ncbi:DUF2345 domain-containing protein, partial [uncultured Deefgea sp.]|uniref:DUF2345 domain-containing protein n=1 Tax=uncultured Deefgea sp. TaxID=1304914 RepID=UPI00261E9EF3
QNLFNAKQEILLTAGGAYIRIKGGKIELHAPGKVSFKGASHDWSGPKSMNIPQVALPRYEPPQGAYAARYQLFKDDRRPYDGYKYKIVGADGEVLKSGITDMNGWTEFANTEERTGIKVYKSVMRESERITEAWESKLNSAVSRAKSNKAGK